jgi:uncharacterized Zn finger protein
MTLTYARFSPRRQGWRLGSWWAKAVLRAVDEAAYDEAQRGAGRSLARSGRVGGLIVSPGTVVASVEDPHAPLSTGESGLFSVRVDLPLLDAEAHAALLEVVVGDPAHRTALLTGELAHDLVEHLEEAGVELLPYAEEFEVACTCRSWHGVCVHALGVLHQLAWLIDPDPLVLLHLRGVVREELRPPRPSPAPSDPTAADDIAEGDPTAHPEVDPVDIALDAALRARALLAE